MYNSIIEKVHKTITGEGLRNAWFNGMMAPRNKPCPVHNWVYGQDLNGTTLHLITSV